MVVYFLVCVYLVISKSDLYSVLAGVSVIDKGILPLEKNSVGMQFYIDAVNTDRVRQCWAQAKAQVCCLTFDEVNDCHTMNVYGVNQDKLKAQDRKTFLFVYPTLIQYDQVGFCEFSIDYEYDDRDKRNVAIRVSFDTRLINKKKLEHLNAFKREAVRKCDSLDQDSQNKCKEINCDFKYLGVKPYFESDTNNCVRALVCFGDVTNELPDSVYMPQSNTCKDLGKPFTLADIYDITSGISVVTKPPVSVPKMKVIVKSNCSTISQNLFLLRDLMCGRLCPILNIDTSGYIECCRSAIISILSCIAALCALLLSVACCVHTTVCMYVKWSKGDFSNCFESVKSKFKKCPIPQHSRIDADVRNALLREVIVKDLPLDVRESIVDICERIGEEVKWKRRYRINELGSQVNLGEAESDSSEDVFEVTSQHETYK